MINYLLPSRAATVETLGHPAAGIIGWSDASLNASGVAVTQQTALTFAAVWCATRVIAETIATLPCLLYERKGDDSRERARKDPRFWLVSEEPHPMISSVSFFETLTAAMVLHGNCYAKIVTSPNGDIKQLEPRSPDQVKVHVDGDRIWYEVTDPQEKMYADDMLHVAGLGGDGISGWSVVRYAGQSIGSGVAAEQYAAGQWANGATPSGVLTHPMRLDKPAREQMRREWEEVHKGSSNANKIAIMHGGMDFKPVSMSNEDAQFLESRQFSVREIARWFRLPPHMLADLADSSVRANIEQQAIEFIVYSLKPWLTRWQQTLNRKLLNKDEREKKYFEFLLESLLQGDSAAQAAAWSVGRQWGWYSVNDIRRMMNMPPVEGGDVYLQPSNMIPADSEMAKGDKPEPPAPPPAAPPQEGEEEQDGSGDDVPESLRGEMQRNLAESLSSIVNTAKELRSELERGNGNVMQYMEAADSRTSQLMVGLRDVRQEIRRDIHEVGQRLQVQGFDAGRQQLVEACHDLLRHSLRVVVGYEKAEVAKAVRKVVRGFNLVAWLDGYYDKHATELAKRIQPAVSCYERIGQPLHGSEDMAATICQQHKASVLGACDGSRDDLPERVQLVLDGWDQEIDTVTIGD